MISEPQTRTQSLEALLFSEGEPIAIKKLASFLTCSEEEVRESLRDLEGRLAGHGLALIMNDSTAALAVAPVVRDLLAETRAKEAERDIGDAGLEVLGILLYEGPSSRASIDYIRGVNSTSTIRTLLERGLVERKEVGREYIYSSTVESLAHLGISRREDLPEYGSFTDELRKFAATQPQTHHESENTSE